MQKRLMKLLLLTLAAVFLAGALGACSAKGNATSDHPFAMADMKDMPVEVQEAPKAVKEAYQFAVANPDQLTDIPCYCGCGAMGHTSNLACYVSGVDGSGKVSFDSHALGCSICVDITQDVMRLTAEGKPHSEIRAYVDSTYQQYGPSNIP